MREVRRRQELMDAPTWQRPRLYAQFWWADHHERLPEYAADYGISAIIHAMLLVVLALIVLDADSTPSVPAIETRISDRAVVDQPEATKSVKLAPIADSQQAASLDRLSKQLATVAIDDRPLALNPPPPIPTLTGRSLQHLGELAGRSEGGRAALVAAFGGSQDSEQAVVQGLGWLVRHQQKDGSWSWDHTHARGCDCSQPGSLRGESGHIGATGLALLTFLGAGQTLFEGAHSPTVMKGIRYVMDYASSRIQPDATVDLRGSNANAGMYQHAIVTIALCEALTMNTAYLKTVRTTDTVIGPDGKPLTRTDVLKANKELQRVAQAAVRFIVDAQHVEGGWRYRPGEAGDMSVVGWQVMALFSAKTAGLHVPRQTLHDAERFLDLTQLDGGARYTYTAGQQSDHLATTAIGLLCRMYFGWDKSTPALQRGVEYVGSYGPQADDMYFNYYATQVLHHWGGDEWTRWNTVQRNGLVKAQDTTGHAAGSWAPRDRHGAGPGGRHYMTCLATMTLEVYYRHLPIYGKITSGLSGP